MHRITYRNAELASELETIGCTCWAGSGFFHFRNSDNVCMRELVGSSKKDVYSSEPDIGNFQLQNI